MLPLGTPLPAFALPDTVSGRTVASAEFAAAPALLVMFLCNHCPYVKHVRDELAAIGRDYGARGVAMVAVSSNDAIAYPADAPALMTVEARDAGYTFPYLYDESQEVARAFQAACTPDFFVFGPDRTLVYRGQLDASRPNSGVPVTGQDLRAALDHVLAGDAPVADQVPSLGCNIKWRFS